MKYFILSLSALFIFCFTVIGQNKDESKKNKPDTACCCKDTDPCFKNDGFYKTLPPDNTKDILLDFKAKALGIPKNLKIKKGDFIRVKVVNYNPLVYRVNVDNRDSSVTQPNDAGLLGMFLSPDKFSSAVAGLINIIGTPPKSVADKGLVGSLGEFSTIMQTIDFGGDDNSRNKKVLDSLKKVLDKESKKAEKILLIYLEDAKTKKTMIVDLRKDIENEFSKISKEYAELQKLYLDCNTLNEETIRAKATGFETSLKKFQAQTRALSSALYDSSHQFKFNLSPYSDGISASKLLTMEYSFVDTFYKIAAAEVNSIDTSVSAKKIDEMYAAFIKLTQNTSCYTSLPIYVGDDIKVLSISLKPVDDKSNLPSYQTSFSIPDYQPRIWGVSGGIFISGMHNDIYTNKRKANDTTFNLVSDKQSKLQVGVNALAYTAWKIMPASPNYLGVCFGAGMSLESKPKPRILLGASFIMGEKNRVSFSVGLTGGYVSTLSDAFSISTTYLTPAENYQKDVLKTSGFFSINYSFISK